MISYDYLVLILLGVDWCRSQIFESNNESSVLNMQQAHTANANPLKQIQSFPLGTSLYEPVINDIAARAAHLLTTESLNEDFNNSTCFSHTKALLEAAKNREEWAMKMVDAIGKPASGLLDMHLNWLGDWEECLKVQAVIYDDPINKTGPINSFNGQYCTASFVIGQAKAVSIALPTNIILSIGMCFPDTCNAVEAARVVSILISLLPVNTTALSNPTLVCQERDIEYTGKAIAVITVCAFFLCIILVATTYDILITYGAWKSKGGCENCASTETAYGLFNKETSESKDNIALPSSNVTLTSTKVTLPRYDNEAVTKSTCDVENVAVEPKCYSSKEAQTRDRQSLVSKVLLSFSVYTNASKILNTSQPSGTLTSVNGIRFISMTWVILGHTFSLGIYHADNSATWLPEVLKRFTFQAISNATFSVDSFFVLSGLLVAYLSLKEMKSVGGVRRFNWGLFYFHRYWRLTPPYMLFLMLYVPTLKYYANGPSWTQTGLDVDECKDTWWTNLLYINNLYKTKKMCMMWSWYLANDMQFYVICPLMLVPLYYSSVLGTLACLALVLANCIANGVISKEHSLPANMLLGDTNNDMFDLTYIKPWCRVGPYAVGFFTGYILYSTNCQVKMSKWLNLLGWSLSTSVAIMVIYGLWTSDGSSKLGIDMSALYNATSRTAWGMCVCWVIYACATGYGGPVNKLLSCRVMIPLSRLTYCTYIVHPVIVYVYYLSSRTLLHWYDLQVVYNFLGNVCLSYAAAFILSLAFESPMMVLEKVLLGRGKRS